MEHLSDKEQIALFKTWWKQYGFSLSLAIIVGLFLGFGWRYWQGHQLQQSAKASEIYSAVLVAKDKKDKDVLPEYVANLTRDYARTPYASLGQLILANEYVDQENYTEALNDLQWVVDNSDISFLKQLASVRSARIYMQQNNYSEAMTVLDAVDSNAYQALVNELKGDIYIKQGKDDLAASSYKKAYNELSDLQQSSETLKMKMQQFSSGKPAQATISKDDTVS